MTCAEVRVDWPLTLRRHLNAAAMTPLGKTFAYATGALPSLLRYLLHSYSLPFITPRVLSEVIPRAFSFNVAQTS